MHQEFAIAIPVCLAITMTHGLLSCAILVVVGVCFSYARAWVMASADELMEEDVPVRIMTDRSTGRL